MSKQKSKESYANLERELGELRQKVAYQYLKRGVIETFVMGRMFGGSRGFAYKPMSETLGSAFDKARKSAAVTDATYIMPVSGSAAPPG